MYGKKIDKSIDVPGYGKLPFASDKSDIYFRKTSIFYGPSNTGKTTMVKHYLKKMQNHIPNIIVVAPNAKLNNDWDGYVPDKFIITSPTEEYLATVLEKQKNAVLMYNTVNNLTTLRSLFMRLNNYSSKKEEDNIKKWARDAIQRTENSSQLNYAQKTENIEKINEDFNEALIKLYKNTIQNGRKSLEQMTNIPENERYSLKYLWYNPSLILILDDCAAQVRKWGKNETINRIFFEGRWFWITSIYTMQSDKGLDPGIRRNTFMNIFTDASCASIFFKNPNNGLTKDQRKKAEILCQFIFKENSNGAKNHKKLIYSRLDPKSKFRYVIAGIHPKFRMGSNAQWKLSDDIPQEKSENDANFTGSFAKSFSL